jgi:16S rRNA (guanine527-N7)-methyltransferase
MSVGNKEQGPIWRLSGADFGPEQFQARFAVSRETMARLRIYEELLRRWQKAHNLVSAKTLDAVWLRHFADCAQLVDLAPDARCWIDLGSGAGFPGLVVALLLRERPGIEVHLVESNQKKCRFLETVRRETGAPVRVHACRAEAAGPDLPDGADVVTARALAPLTGLLELAAPFMVPGHTQALFLKGRDVDAELTEASRYWKLEADLHPSLADREGQILQIHAVARR